MTAAPRLLVLMGSGETAPTMMKPHRQIFDRFASTDVSAVMLDTPYGFQENADVLTEKSLQYFADSVYRPVQVAGLRRTDLGNVVDLEGALARIRQADWLFAGPGSPSFALRQWRDTPVPDVLKEKLEIGGVLVFSSAAALTVGVSTIPVYEVYKVGQDPHWLEGLDLLSAIELPVSVVPHYNNTEGGNHDTRFCYLGESRLAKIEPQLRNGSFILGIDEHTGIILDLDADTAEIFGKGQVTVRRNGQSEMFGSDQIIAIDQLRHAADGRSTVIASSEPNLTAQAGETEPEAAKTSSGISLLSTAQDCERQFDRALSEGQGSDAVKAILDLEEAIVAWATDTTQNDDSSQARAILRSLVARLGPAVAAGLRDQREVLGPVVDVVLKVRSAVRGENRYDLSDLIRDELAEANIEVRDTPEGIEWLVV